MTVTSVHKDPEHMTMTITSEFDAPIGRVWHMWENPRQLERWRCGSRSLLWLWDSRIRRAKT